MENIMRITHCNACVGTRIFTLEWNNSNPLLEVVWDDSCVISKVDNTSIEKFLIKNAASNESYELSFGDIIWIHPDRYQWLVENAVKYLKKLVQKHLPSQKFIDTFGEKFLSPFTFGFITYIQKYKCYECRLNNKSNNKCICCYNTQLTIKQLITRGMVNIYPNPKGYYEIANLVLADKDIVCGEMKKSEFIPIISADNEVMLKNLKFKFDFIRKPIENIANQPLTLTLN